MLAIGYAPCRRNNGELNEDRVGLKFATIGSLFHT